MLRAARRSPSGARSRQPAARISRGSACSPGKGWSAPAARMRSASSRCAPGTWSAITRSSSAASASASSSSTARRAASAWPAARCVRHAGWRRSGPVCTPCATSWGCKEPTFCKSPFSRLEARPPPGAQTIQIKKAQRIQALPPYLFASIDRVKKELLARGVDVINLGVGAPDTPTPAHIVARLAEAAADPANHRYPDYEGLLAFRQAAARWMERRYGVRVDPATEVVSLIGSKEGIANMAVAFVDPGDIVLVPHPGYPVYHIGAAFNGGTTYRMPLRRENGFLPDLRVIPPQVARRAKLLRLNYPHNPTAAVAPRGFFADAIRFAERHDVILCHDAAYAELYFGEARAQPLPALPPPRAAVRGRLSI